MPAAPGFEKESLIKGDESESLGFDLADHGRVVDNGLRRRNKDDKSAGGHSFAKVQALHLGCAAPKPATLDASFLE